MKKRSIVDGKYWVEEEGSLSRVGLTKEMVETFDHVEWIKLPAVGEKLNKGDQALIIESSKAAIDIDSPVSGIVVEVNASLLLEPQELERVPETTWLFVVTKED